MRNRVLWALQWIFGLYFIAIGVMHFVLPEGLPAQLDWMYDLDDTIHLISGTAEILGGLGLILPGLIRIQPMLTPIAALGLLVIMVAAMVWHLGREEYVNIGLNIVNAVALAYIAYGRARLEPIAPR